MTGHCSACRAEFTASLIHNGFNESSYAYCAKCGMAAVCDHSHWPPQVPRGDRGPLEPEQIAFLASCSCGGRFHTHAQPRCPNCQAPLNPEEATEWIEAGIPATNSSWHWQKTWRGLYALVVDDRVVKDPWSPDISAP